MNEFQLNSQISELQLHNFSPQYNSRNVGIAITKTFQMIIGCKKPIITVVYLLSFFTFVLTIGFILFTLAIESAPTPWRLGKVS